MENYLTLFQDSISSVFKTPAYFWQHFFDTQPLYEKWVKEMDFSEEVWLAGLKEYCLDYQKLCVHTLVKLEDTPAFLTQSVRDKRFTDSQWWENPVFYFYQQAYQLWVKYCLGFIEENACSDPKLNKQILFFTKQYLDALAPTNFPFTNPQVIKETILTNGQNLTKGLKNFTQDWVNGKGYWNVTSTDKAAFVVGENIAKTPGKVIYKNKMMELIQYSPTTAKVFQKPVLIVPPLINKYYILDLRQENSFVKWMVDEGLTVFMISWVNPDENYRQTTFEDYIDEGILKAFTEIEKATLERKVNCVGFCLGGTLLCAALALLRAKKEERVQSATFLASLIDFSDPGEIEVFINEKHLAYLENKMDTEGYLDGRLLMTTFNFLKSNELFWSYYVKNYLCGWDPHPFDMLHWNADVTHLPANMFKFYLRNLYLENRLCKPNNLELRGIPINLSTIETPSYFVGTEFDHIAPWKSVFAGAKCFKGPVTFTQGGSGHISGIVNPPHLNKYYFRSTEQDVKLFKDASLWLDSAQQHAGSWWGHWKSWLGPYLGETQGSRIPTQGWDAPGEYVKKSL